MSSLPHRLCALVAGAALAACGGYRSAHPAAPRGVAAAGLPFIVLDGRSGHELTADELWARLRGARAVCAGEQHDNPHDHWVQLQVLDHVSAPPAAGTLALGFEMVQQPFQGVLDDWGARRIDDAALLARTDWEHRWGFDFALYRPMLALARERHVALLALNAPAELVKRVAKVGIDGLAADERAKLPQLELADAQHRAWFESVVGGDHAHGGPPPAHDGAAHDPHDAGAPAAGAHDPHDADADTDAAPDAQSQASPARPSLDDIYAAQVVWDESMADRAARWLEHGGHVVILAGNGHCHDSAIVRRLQRRGIAPAVSVRAIIDDGEGNVADALAEGINDFLVVLRPPR